MFGTIKKLVRGRGRTAMRAAPAAFLLAMVCCAVPAGAYMDKENPLFDMGYNPNGVFILDGSYVMNVGELHINITNWGLIGSRFSSNNQFSDAPSAQWPAGSGELLVAVFAAPPGSLGLLSDVGHPVRLSRPDLPGSG